MSVTKKISNSKPSAWRTFAMLALSSSTLVWAGQAHAQSVQYPASQYQDRGGSLGVQFEGLYTFQGTTCAMVAATTADSPLADIVAQGDCIYGIDAFNLRSMDDYYAAVVSKDPGSSTTVWFFDAADGYGAKYYTTSLIADFPAPSSGSSGQSFCGENPVFCVVGGTIALGWLAGLFGSSEDSSYSDSQYDSCSTTPGALCQGERFDSGGNRVRD